MGTPRTAIVTGATSGLGKDIVNRLLGKGYLVYGWGRNWEKSDYKGRSPYFIPQAVNICSISDVMSALHNTGGDTLDVLINNAGVFSERPFRSESFTNIDHIIDTNLKGTMSVTLGVLQTFVNVNRIINIGSVSGLDGIHKQAIYSASKAGLRAFSNSLSQELKDTQVTTIIPGGIDTELWDKHNVRNTESFMDTYDVWKAIEFVIESDLNVTIKEIVMFPKEEYHP